MSKKQKAVILSIILSGIVLWWYFAPFIWLGVVMGLLVGFITYYMLSSGHIERVRRLLFIALFVLMVITLVLTVVEIGSITFFDWVERWDQGYYSEGTGGKGALTYPTPLIIPSIFWRGADFVVGVGWQAVLPTTLGLSLALLVPYAIIFIVFGKAACGWLCPLGGLVELFSSGRKSWWQLNFVKQKTLTDSGNVYTNLKSWVYYVKYIFLLLVIVLSFLFSFAIVNIFFPMLWLKSLPVFWIIMGILLVFAVLLPVMTKNRWWCFICPVGGLLSLLKRFNFFRVKIDKDRCIRCMDCVQECPVFALTPKSVDTGEILGENCIRCGRCIEVCPDEAIDIYWFGRQRKAKSQFIAITLATVFAIYIWFIVLLVSYLS
ncbi:MAG: 4Fe-4S binding protein [Dehalococcoidia bacterium]|nr:MAG: 4Fe-4S binding protein [Dehalococcoidia bacterium]